MYENSFMQLLMIACLYPTRFLRDFSIKLLLIQMRKKKKSLLSICSVEFHRFQGWKILNLQAWWILYLPDQTIPWNLPTFTTRQLRATLIGLIFARLNFAFSRIFALFVKLNLAKSHDIADSRNKIHREIFEIAFSAEKLVKILHLRQK